MIKSLFEISPGDQEGLARRGIVSVFQAELYIVLNALLRDNGNLSDGDAEVKLLRTLWWGCCRAPTHAASLKHRKGAD